MGEFKVMLGEGVCREWRDIGKDWGLLRWYVFWLFLYLVNIFEEEFIRFIGVLLYDWDVDGILCCCWLVILLEGKFGFGRLFFILLLEYFMLVELLNMFFEVGLGRIGCGWEDGIFGILVGGWGYDGWCCCCNCFCCCWVM